MTAYPCGSRSHVFSFSSLPPHHGAKENDQNSDGNERERRAREKFRRSIQTLATARSHESDQRQHQAHAVTDQGHGESR